MQDEFIYRTIPKRSEGIYKEKGSKFLSFAIPVSDERDIREELAALRKQYHDARHHCFAYRVGTEKTEYRLSDDGEPPGTAGKPIYRQLLARDLTNVLLVIVRYFGGTKLGTSGLIRAYRSASSDALNKTRIVTRRIEESYRIHFGFDQMDPVMRIIRQNKMTIKSQRYDNECSMEVKIWKKKLHNVLKDLEWLSGVTIEKAI